MGCAPAPDRWQAYHSLPMSSVAGVVAVVLASVLVGLTVAGWFGRFWWVFDLASNFRVQYAVLLLPVTMGLFLGHRWGLAVPAAVAFIANLIVILPLYVSKPSPPAGGDRLLVMSFNMNFNNEDLGVVLESIRASDVDVVFLHEGTRAVELAVREAGLRYDMLSGRDEDERFGTIALFPEEASARVVDLQIPGVAVTVPLGDRHLEVMGMHPLSPVTRERSAGRDAQLEAAADWSARQSLPVAVTGDFNASTWSHGFSRISRLLENSQIGFGVQASWPAGFRVVGIPIDHLVHTGELTVVDRHLGPPLGSDHHPLYVTLAWAER